MKYLTLIRHAKSDWSDPQLTDFDRPLNARGKKAAPLMGRRICERGIRPELLLSSPAKRARKTAQLIARELGIDKDAVGYEQSIFEARRQTLSDLLAAVRKADHVALIGHNPGLSDLAVWLCPEAPEWLPTCGVLQLELDIKSWKKLHKGGAKILYYDYPKKAD